MVFIINHCAMFHLTSRVLIVLCITSLVACSAKTSRQVSSDLWGEWELFDQQVQPDYPDAIPIILIHGWNGGEFSWPGPRTLMLMEQQLHRDIYFFNYRTGVVANRFPPIELLEEQLDIYLKNYPQVDVVAHSMGGLLLRQYLSEHSDNPVRRVLFLSTPHFGSSIANLLVDIGAIAYTGNIQASEMLPGSDFLWQLNSMEGVEFDGISVLNVYAREQENPLEGDLIVSTSHAWLPWVHNATVIGDHHLGRRINEPWALEFLRSGQRPPEAPMPSGRELWLRLQLPDQDTPAMLNETSVRRLGAGKVHSANKPGLCCDQRSGLHPLGGTTLILEDIKPGDRVKYYPRNGSGSRQISIDELDLKAQPVQMQIVQLPRQGEAGTP